MLPVEIVISRTYQCRRFQPLLSSYPWWNKVLHCTIQTRPSTFFQAPRISRWNKNNSRSRKRRRAWKSPWSQKRAWARTQTQTTKVAASYNREGASCPRTCKRFKVRKSWRRWLKRRPGSSENRIDRVRGFSSTRTYMTSRHWVGSGFQVSSLIRTWPRMLRMQLRRI